MAIGSATIEIRLNGEPRRLAGGSTVADLLDELGLRGRPLAVEVNRRLVPRAEHQECLLKAGDQVEIVTLVGGG